MSVIHKIITDHQKDTKFSLKACECSLFGKLVLARSSGAASSPHERNLVISLPIIYWEYLHQNK